MRDVPKLSLQARIEREVASLLKERREKLGLSKVVTAERAGVAVMTIFFAEELKRSPSLKTLLKIADALECDLWQLLHTATANAKRADNA